MAAVRVSKTASATSAKKSATPAKKPAKKASSTAVGAALLSEVRDRPLPPWAGDRLTLYSWNVNGIRAVVKKGFFDWVNSRQADIVCLQETRARTDQVRADSAARSLLEDPAFSWYWSNAEKSGYSGTATFARCPSIAHQIGFANDPPVRNFNSEGRVIITEFPWFVLWNVYFPNGGRGPERVEYKLAFYEHCLKLWEDTRRAGKKLIVCGDVNTAHREIDLARPKENQKTSGFLPEERAFLDKISGMGYVDIFRRFDPSPGKYTYWDQITRARERNSGWRIDYFWVTEETVPMIERAWIESDVMGSDHCPIGIEVRIG